MLRAIAVALLAFAGACAPRLPDAGPDGPPPCATEVEVGAARFRVLYWPGDERSATQVSAALAHAVRDVSRWGALSVPVTVTIHPSHEALEAAVRRSGFGWLRAWARYRSIELQSPRTWSLLGAADAEVRELLTHELTHCVMYQVSGTELTWAYRGIPLWFREGLASVTASQGYRRGKLEDLWRFYDERPDSDGGALADRGAGTGGGDPIADPEPLYQRRSELVYGASHHAFRFLLDRYGPERVRNVLRRMGDGAPFARAFREAIGIGEPEFTAEFRRYVAWQGWRASAR